ncbi:MAG: RidA family protein [Deltaproteobacteria bacterium]|nr:RidA family protein [Deltaproteobacteria bacterium]
MGNAVLKEVLNPPAWKKPRGYSNLVKTTGGAMLFAAGQGASDPEGRLIGEGDICRQYEQILHNIQEVMAAGGAQMTDIVRLTIYCTDRDAFLAKGKECSQIYRKYFGDYYPASTLVEIKKLFFDDMLLEIEATAVI